MTRCTCERFFSCIVHGWWESKLHISSPNHCLKGFLLWLHSAEVLSAIWSATIRSITIMEDFLGHLLQTFFFWSLNWIAHNKKVMINVEKHQCNTSASGSNITRSHYVERWFADKHAHQKSSEIRVEIICTYWYENSERGAVHLRCSVAILECFLL